MKFRIGALKSNLVLAAVSALLLSPTIAPAADLGLANKFNLFSFGDVTTQGGHSEGAIAVGGNWQGQYEANQHNHGATFDTAVNAGIYANANVTVANFIKVFAGSNAYVGGALAGSLDMLGGGTVYNTVNSALFDQQYAYSVGQSLAIRNAAKEAITINDINNINLNVSGNNLNGSLRVYEVQASQLSSLSTFNISGMDATDTLIIDVVGDDIDWGWQVNAQYKNRILWNFRDAEDILVQKRNMTGSILAPWAHIDQRNNIQGNVIAGSFSNVGAPELHYGNQFTFEGDTFEPVPEPGTMLVLGVGAALAARRKRKA